MYRDRYDQLLTRNYRYYDTLHTVLPTRLPREEFYRPFASLCSHLGPDASLDLVGWGELSMAKFKRGYRLLAKMSQCKHYLETDPALCRRDGGEDPVH